MPFFFFSFFFSFLFCSGGALLPVVVSDRNFFFFFFHRPPWGFQTMSDDGQKFPFFLLRATPEHLSLHLGYRSPKKLETQTWGLVDGLSWSSFVVAPLPSVSLALSLALSCSPHRLLRCLRTHGRWVKRNPLPCIPDFAWSHSEGRWTGGRASGRRGGAGDSARLTETLRWPAIFFLFLRVLEPAQPLCDFLSPSCLGVGPCQRRGKGSARQQRRSVGRSQKFFP